MDHFQQTSAKFSTCSPLGWWFTLDFHKNILRLWWVQKPEHYHALSLSQICWNLSLEVCWEISCHLLWHFNLINLVPKSDKFHVVSFGKYMVNNFIFIFVHFFLQCSHKVTARFDLCFSWEIIANYSCQRYRMVKLSGMLQLIPYNQNKWNTIDVLRK